MSNTKRLVYSTATGSLRGKKMRKSAASPAPARSSSKQGVRIRRECKGRGGKTVSVIEGLPMDEAAMKALLKRLKTRLGTGGAIKQGCIEIQGDHRELLLKMLADEGLAAKLAGG